MKTVVLRGGPADGIELVLFCDAHLIEIYQHPRIPNPEDPDYNPNAVLEVIKMEYIRYRPEHLDLDNSEDQYIWRGLWRPAGKDVMQP